MNENIEDLFASLAARDEDGDETPHLPVKGVTVRLDAEQRAELMALSSMTGMNRQQILQTLVITGLEAATSAYLSNSSDRVQADFAEQVRDFLIADGVHPHLAEQISGFDYTPGENNQ